MIFRDSNHLFGKLKIRLWGVFAAMTASTRSLLAFKTLLVKYRHEGKRVVFGDLHKYTAWYTYPFLDFIRLLDFSDLDIFEFGSGYSTLYWAGRAKSVTSVEHSKAWFQTVNNLLKSSGIKNVDLFLQEDSTSYVNSINLKSRSYDVIIVDGISRFEAAKASTERLCPNGVIILDNSDWCPDTVEYLVASGFCHIPFSGFGPAAQLTWSTSLFFRTLQNPVLVNAKNAVSLGMIKPSEADYMFDGEHN